MPGPAFFQQLGLFVQRNFLDLSACARICQQSLLAEAEEGATFGGDPQKGGVDQTIRKTLYANVGEPESSWVGQRLMQVKGRLEEHFREKLADFEGPCFLRYSEGSFYKPHRDVSPAEVPEGFRRRISVVIFLNSQAQEPAPDRYGEGALTFHGLLSGAEWENCAFPLDAEPGLLVAFHSDTWHEVRPVTFGHRFTIVAWFNA